jgi:vacuolar-type H+-ATPase subunit I/STV1
MDWQTADTILDERVKKYQFDCPEKTYQEAAEAILAEDPELEAAYNGTDSPRTANIKRQFELDRKLKENPGDPAGDITRFQYVTTMCGAMGWRQAARIYGIDLEKEIKEKIQKEVMSLENQLILYKKTISNYPEEEKRLKEIIESLQAKLGSDVGYTPTIAEIEKQQNKLLKLARDFAEAEENLPIVEKRLNTLRGKLEKIEKGKKFSFSTPSEELSERAKAYAQEHEIDYGEAVDVIMEDDPVLHEAYSFRNFAELLGVEG